ncbi:hypothetical protein N4C11_003996 [Salmonella enterica]|nr:hypothetical protein [Salmonella enterica]
MLSISHQIFLSGWMKRRSAVKNNTIEIYRRRIAIAALGRMKRKTGSNCVIVNMSNGDIQKIDFDEKSMLTLLMRFERQACSEYGISESTSFIRSTYRNSLNINGHTEYLTETGKLIVDELLGEVITWAKEKYFSGGIN